MTKIYDLSQQIVNGACMWPRFAGDIQMGAGSFEGIRSTGWHNENHPGWYDMGQPFPFQQGWGELHRDKWVGHMHVATHVDAPIYMFPEGITLKKIPLENLYGTGVILDMRNKKKWDLITADDFEKATPKIQEGDFVVVPLAGRMGGIGHRRFCVIGGACFMNSLLGITDLNLK